MSQRLASRARHESSVPAFLHRQLRQHPAPLPPGTTLAGQTAVVTGANSGLGLEFCRQALGLGLSRLIMGVRSPERGDSAAAELRRDFPGARIDVWRVDMEDYGSIREFAARCRGGEEDDPTTWSVDLVVLNAGIQNASFGVSAPTGHEQMFQVNYLSTALLALLLLPALLRDDHRNTKDEEDDTGAAAYPPVLSIVSSDTSYWAKVDISPSSWSSSSSNLSAPHTTTTTFAQQFDDPEGFDPIARYSGAKLLLNWFVAELAERVLESTSSSSSGRPPEPPIVVTCLNPGLCAPTNLAAGLLPGAEGGGLGWLMGSVLVGMNTFLARDPRDGASAYLDGILGGDGEAEGGVGVKRRRRDARQIHGSFMSDWAVKPWPEVMYTEDGRKAQKRLWEETIKELESVKGVEEALKVFLGGAF